MFLITFTRLFRSCDLDHEFDKLSRLARVFFLFQFHHLILG